MNLSKTTKCYLELPEELLTELMMIDLFPKFLNYNLCKLIIDYWSSWIFGTLVNITGWPSIERDQLHVDKSELIDENVFNESHVISNSDIYKLGQLIAVSNDINFVKVKVIGFDKHCIYFRNTPKFDIQISSSTILSRTTNELTIEKISSTLLALCSHQSLGSYRDDLKFKLKNDTVTILVEYSD